MSAGAGPVALTPASPRWTADPWRARAQVRLVSVLRFALLVLLAGNLVRLPALTSGAREAPVSLNDLAVLTALACGAFAMLRARRLLLDGVARWALLFACVGALSAVLAIPRFGLTPREVLFSLAYLARWLLYFCIYVVAINGLRRADAVPLVGAIEWVVMVFAGFGILQSIFLPGFAQLVYPDAALFVDWDPQGRRLVSTFLDPNFAGAFIVVGFVLALARLSCGARGVAPRLWLLVVALVFTASRSSMLAAVAGAVTVAIGVGVSRKVIRLSLAFGVLGLLASPVLLSFASTYGKLGIDASALQRVVAWARALQVIGDHPIIGVGFNTYGFVQRAYGGAEASRAAFAYSLDGGLLFIAVMTGMVGVVLYVGMLRRMAKAARRVYRSPVALPAERALAIGAVAATVALVVHSAFVNSLLHPFLMEPLWLLWAAVAVLARSIGTAHPAPEPTP
ncbi:MAG: O-antigen ligase family protein [Gemmatirosa sp.]